MDPDLLAYKQWQASQGGGGADINYLAYGNNPRKIAEDQMLKRKKSTGIGSLLGGIVGGVGGGVLGSAIPVAGTTGGAIAGGAAGSALGEAIDQFLTSGKLSGGDIAREGAIGAAGGVAGKVLGAGGKLLARGATTAAVDAGEAAAKTGLRAGLKQKGNQLLASQYGTIPAPIARSTDLPNTVGKLADLGITKPQDAERIAGAITGSGGEINKAVLKATGSAGRVDTDGLTRIANDAIENLGLVDKDAKSVRSVINAQMKRMAGGPKGTLAPGADPNDALSVMKALEKRAADLKGKGGNYRLSTPEREDQANVLLQVRNEIADRLYGGAGANENLPKVLTPELRDKLVTLMPNNKKWVDYVDNTVMKTGDVGDLRSTMAPFTRINKAIEAADVNVPTFGGRVGNNFGGLPGMVQTAAQSGPVKNVGGRILRAAGSTPKLPGSGLGIPSQAAGQIGARAMAGGPQEDMSRLVPVDGSESGQPSSVDLTGADISGAGAGITPDMIQQMAIEDVQKTGGKNLDEVAKLASIMSASTPKEPKKNATQLDKQNKATAGLQALDNIEQMMSQDPSVLVKAAIPGSPGARAYEAARKQALDMVSRLQTGAALTKEEEKFYSSQLPQPFDSPQAIQFKLQQLRNYFQGVAGSPSATEEPLMQGM